MGHGTVQWGDVPTWVGAVGTVLAFAIALVIYGQSQIDRRREQARHVSGWVPGGPALIPSGQQLHGTLIVADVDRVELQLKIKNGSPDMISDVKATVLSSTGEDLGLEPVGWTDVGPGQEIELGHFPPDTGRVRGELRMRLRFTDSAGRRWERFGGTLKRTRLD